MNTPHLNRKLVLQTPDRSPDGSGGYTITWRDLGTVWAAVKPGSGREYAGIAVSLSRVPVRVTVRSAPVGNTQRPLPDQRFVEGGRVFLIVAVTESDPGGRFLTCHALEEVAA